MTRDRKQCGLLHNTLLVWGGEFERTPMVEIRTTRGVNTASALV